MRGNRSPAMAKGRMTGKRLEAAVRWRLRSRIPRGTTHRGGRHHVDGARAISTLLLLALTIACGRSDSSGGSAASHLSSSSEPGRLDGAGVAIDAGITAGATGSLVDVVLALYDAYAWAQLRAERPVPPPPDDCGEVRVTVTADGVVVPRVDQARALGDYLGARLLTTGKRIVVFALPKSSHIGAGWGAS